MSKVVVVIDETGELEKVLVDDKSTEVLVLNRETWGENQDHVADDVLGAPALLDTTQKGLAKFSPDNVARAFREVVECTKIPSKQGRPLNAVRRHFDPLPKDECFKLRPETPARIKNLFHEVGDTGVTKPVVAPDGSWCKISFKSGKEPARHFATLFRTATGWTATVHSKPMEDGTVNTKEITVPKGSTAFIAAAHVIEFYGTYQDDEFDMA